MSDFKFVAIFRRLTNISHVLVYGLRISKKQKRRNEWLLMSDVRGYSSSKTNRMNPICLPRDACSFSLVRFLLTNSFLLVFKPHVTLQSDAEALRLAKLEAQGLPAEPEAKKQPRADRREMATDDQVMERFKKRMRK